MNGWLKTAAAGLAAGGLLLAGTGLAAEPEAGFGRVPPHFIRNEGQLDPEVRYYRKGPRGTVYLTGDGVVFDFISGREEGPDRLSRLGEGPQGEETGRAAVSRLVFRFRFIDPGPETAVEGEKQLPGTVNYFIGPPENWRSAVPTFEEVTYRGLYPGIDLACRFSGGNLAYRFAVSPGADPGRIALGYSGADGLEITPDGDLVVLTPLGGFRTPPPRAYQEIDGRTSEVKASFKLRDESAVALDIGDRDTDHPLVVEF